MRGLVLVLLASCSSSSGQSSDGPVFSQFCGVGVACPNNEVCARSNECAAASDIRTVHVNWTVGGVAASATTCAAAPDLTIYFSGGDHTLGFEPVPCVEGRFSIDALPIWYDYVQLGQGGRLAEGALDDAGEVDLDLHL